MPVLHRGVLSCFLPLSAGHPLLTVKFLSLPHMGWRWTSGVVVKEARCDTASCARTPSKMGLEDVLPGVMERPLPHRLWWMFFFAVHRNWPALRSLKHCLRRVLFLKNRSQRRQEMDVVKKTSSSTGRGNERRFSMGVARQRETCLRSWDQFWRMGTACCHTYLRGEILHLQTMTIRVDQASAHCKILH